MMPFSTRRPSERICVTCLRPSACLLQCTTRSMQDATVGNTKALAFYVKPLLMHGTRAYSSNWLKRQPLNR